MFKKTNLLTCLSALLALTMVLAACTPAATTVAPTSTAMPVPPTYTPYVEPTKVPTEAAAEEPTVAPTEAPVKEAYVNAWGVTLPEDAAPPEQQYIKKMGSEGVTTDFAVTVYKRGDSNVDILSTSFVRLDKNFNLNPAGALSWEMSEDGKTWTFHMDPELTWSNGTPVTADDIVFTFQYEADPVHAWDFAWFWSDIVGFSDAVAGKIPVDQIGVKKVDDYTVQFQTIDASPYFLAKTLYVRPLCKSQFEKYGEYYNSTPETSVSSTPWILEEWTKGKQIVFGPNLNYTGDLKPYLERLIIVFGDTSTEFLAYQNNEVDLASTFTPADIAMISADPTLNAEYHPGFGDFRTYYIGFNTYEAPFNDIKVRTAFAKAIDREAIITNIVGRTGIAAYSFLMPGFPAADSEAYKAEDVNTYDVEAAKALLAEAGYADGANFPKLELWLRDEGDMIQSIAAAIASQLTENLGVQVEVSNKESKLFMEQMNAHTLQFYMISYGFDYLDPSNMLGIWTTGGRHAWTNEAFDTLIKEASAFTGDANERTQMFKDAEKILVEDVGGIFIYHQTPGNIYKPYLKGTELEPDNVGVAAIHWPNFESIGSLMSSIYISEDVVNYRK